MLVPNTDIWQTRVQNIDALLTASAGGRDEVYYLATVCQVSLDPPLVTVSPNPEYPVCAVIESAGHFGVNFLSDLQGDLVARCMALDRAEPAKLATLGVAHERTGNGTPLLLDCLQALECRVERAWDSGDHRTILGRVIERRARDGHKGRGPHRFGGGRSWLGRVTKQLACRSRLPDLVRLLRGQHAAVGLAEGTARLCEPVHLPGAVPFRQAPRPPGICLVGCGWWGRVHALAMKRLGPNVRRYFASRDLGRAREFAARFAGEALDGLDAALADPRVHAVILALPHDLHAAAARRAIEAGKHVLVEKPLALTDTDGEALVRQAEGMGLCLAVAEEYRVSPLVRAAGEVLRRGELGRVTLAQVHGGGLYRPDQAWKNRREAMGGGVLLDVGIHYVSILRHWFGEPELAWAAAAPRANAELEGEDGAVAALRFPGGPAVTLQVSWSAFRGEGTPNLEVMGENGSLKIWFARPYLLLTTPLSDRHWANWLRRKLPGRVEARVGRWLPQVRRRRVPVPPGDLIGSQALLEDFVRAITTGAAPAVPGREGLRDLRVVLALYRALQTGAAVTPD